MVGSQQCAAGLNPFGIAGPVQRWFRHNGQRKSKSKSPNPIISSRNESRRDSAAKPKVARNELPWVTSGRIESTPKELCHLAIRMGTTSFEVDEALKRWIPG